MTSITSEDYVMNSSILIWVFYGFAAKYDKLWIGEVQDDENTAN